MAEAYLTAQGFNIVAQAEALNGTDIVLSDTFKPLKEDGWKKGDAQAYTRSIAKTLAAARFIRYESRRASHAIA